MAHERHERVAWDSELQQSRSELTEHSNGFFAFDLTSLSLENYEHRPQCRYLLLSKHRLTRQNTLRQVHASPQPVRISYLSRANHFILNLASDMFV
jgi:hypothetical protein